MPNPFIKLPPRRLSWHSVGDAAGMRRILRLWDILIMRRHLADLPDEGHVYEELHEVLRRSGASEYVRTVRSSGYAFELVTVTMGRLRELTDSLEWLYDALADDHDGKYETVDGHLVVLDIVDDPPCTDLSRPSLRWNPSTRSSTPRTKLKSGRTSDGPQDYPRTRNDT